MIKDLKHLVYEERLRKLRLSPEKSRLRRINVYKYLVGGSKDDRHRLLVISTEITRSNWYKLEEEIPFKHTHRSFLV